MTMNSCPPFRALNLFIAVPYTQGDGIEREPLTTFKDLFPALRILKITALALESLLPGSSVFCRSGKLEAHELRQPRNAAIPDVRNISFEATLSHVCPSLPSLEGESSTHIDQWTAGRPAIPRTSHLNSMTSRLFRMLHPHGQASLHNMVHYVFPSTQLFPLHYKIYSPRKTLEADLNLEYTTSGFLYLFVLSHVPKPKKSKETNPNEEVTTCACATCDGSTPALRGVSSWTIFGDAEYASRPPRATTELAKRNRAHIQTTMSSIEERSGHSPRTQGINLEAIDGEGESGYKNLRFRLPGYHEACEVCGCAK